MRQESILLGLIETVNLINEKHRNPGEGSRLLNRGSNILDARQHRGNRQKLRVTVMRNEPRQRRFTGARRAPEQH